MRQRYFIVGVEANAEELAKIEADHARESAWRLEQSLLALRCWRFMRQGHSMASAHAAAVAAVTAGATT
jgi:hypothetical protein